MDLVDAESEIRGEEIILKDLLMHPQFELAGFLLEYLTHKEDCFELIPTNTKAAHLTLDHVIRSLDAVTSRGRSD